MATERPKKYRLPQWTLDELAYGLASPETIARLRSAEYSKHVLLVHGVLRSAARNQPAAYARLALPGAWQLLARAQEHAPGVFADMIAMPWVGAWAIDCLQQLRHADHNDPALGEILAHFGAIAAAVGLRSRVGFEIRVLVRDGRLALPGFGTYQVSVHSGFVRLRHSPRPAGADVRLVVGGRALALPAPLQRTRRLVLRHAGIGLDLLFEADPYLDRYRYPLDASLAETVTPAWARRFSGAWQILADHHRTHAAAISSMVRVIVPLAPETHTHTVSATSAAAFGAVALSLPPDDLTLAETLVHESQHLKLCALSDQVSFVQPGHGGLYYAPWRDDPRWLSGLLQGAYAFLGVTQFWRTQRMRLVADLALRGHAEFARRRAEALAVTHILLESGGLTAAGTRFVSRMRERLLDWRTDEVPPNAQSMADDVTTDHRLTWQLRHLVPNPDLVDRLVKCWEAGNPADSCGPTDDRVRVVPGSSAPCGRGVMLVLRYTDPGKFRMWLAGREPAEPGRARRAATEFPNAPRVSAADVALLRGDSPEAVRAYTAEIMNGSANPESWAGLALAACSVAGAGAARTLFEDAPLLHAVHARIRLRKRMTADPLQLADWLADGSSTSPGHT